MARPKLPWNHPAIVARFIAKLEPVPGSTCIEFGGMISNGWGRMVAWDFPGCPAGRVWAHRYAFAIFRGPLDELDTLDHTCRNRACVNPYHLEPLGRSEHGSKSNADRWGGDPWSEPPAPF